MTKERTTSKHTEGTQRNAWEGWKKGMVKGKLCSIGVKGLGIK